MRLTHKSNKINLDKPLVFTFNNKKYKGFLGDTLASALIANDYLCLTRSFKYGRKRGIMSAGIEETNALISLEHNGYYTPNLKATEITLYDGLNAISALNPNDFSLPALIKPLHRFMLAGFYYKTFIKQAYWARVESYIRAISGFSKAPTKVDKEYYDHHHHHCDVLIIGGGVAGMSAAAELLEKSNNYNLRVILVDERPQLGGEILTDVSVDSDINNWYNTTIAKLVGFTQKNDYSLVLLKNTTALAWHDHNFIQAVEKVSDHINPKYRVNNNSPRQILHKIRAQHVILATGAHERPMLFKNNDLINIMLAQAIKRYACEFGVISGKKIVLYGNNDSIYDVAKKLAKLSINVCVIDVRDADTSSYLLAELKDLGVKILQGYAIIKAQGKGYKINKIVVVKTNYVNNSWQLASDCQTIYCDLLGTSGGFSPVIHLYCHTGSFAYFDESTQSFLVTEKQNNRRVVGAVNGVMYWDDAIIDAKNKAQCVLQALGANTLNNDFLKKSSYKSLKVSKFFTPNKILSMPKVFIDLQNDVTTLDVKLAITEGYQSIEHIKRYTAMGFGTDQGKTGNINGIAVTAELLNKPLTEMNTTTFRPAYTGVAFGALAGRCIGDFFDPQRFTTIHKSHLELGAKFELVGQWYRPWYYPQPGEDIHKAVERECLATRTSLGMMDASTLGKIDIQGTDAREFLSRVYTNAWLQLKAGSCRYGIMCNEKGMIIDDGVSACINDNHFIMTTTTGGAASVYATLEMWLQTEWPYLQVKINSVTDQYATIAVVGPNARYLMRLLCADVDFDKKSFKFMQWREGMVCNVKARIMRISFSGELAYEINVGANYGSYIWQQVYKYGKKFNITPYGTETMHVLRAEKGYIIVGQDTDGSMTPYDVNMNWILANNKDFSYIGKRSFTLPALNNDKRLQLVGLYTKDAQKVLPEGAHIIDTQYKSIGYVTSSYFSAILGRSIALAQVENGLAKMNALVEVAVGSCKQNFTKIACTIVSSVFYDAKGERIDGND